MKHEQATASACVSRETAAEVSDAPATASPAHANRPAKARGIWERDEAYPCIVQDGDLRVIECKDAIQWILQRRRKGGEWADLGYFRNRDVLIARCKMGADAVAMLRALPAFHCGRAGSG
jgi:hypothetical protein